MIQIKSDSLIYRVKNRLSVITIHQFIVLPHILIIWAKLQVAKFGAQTDKNFQMGVYVCVNILLVPFCFCLFLFKLYTNVQTFWLSPCKILRCIWSWWHILTFRYWCVFSCLRYIFVLMLVSFLISFISSNGNLKLHI